MGIDIEKIFDPGGIYAEDEESSSTGYTTYAYDEEDPYKYWRESGLSAGYGAATSELLRGIAEARDPESSAIYRQGRRALTQGNAVANEQARQAMAGRGTAFSGQAATASRDILGGQNRALMELLMGVRTQGYDLASQLGSLSASTLRDPIYNLASEYTTSSSTVPGDSGFGELLGSLGAGAFDDWRNSSGSDLDDLDFTEGG